MKRIITLTVLLLAVLLGGCDADWGVDQHGRPVASDDLDGRWLVINYWAEWCAPCRTEVPELNRLASTRPDVAVLGVNFDELRGEQLAQAVEALGIRFRVLSEDPAERLGLERSPVLPVTYLVDTQGKVRERLVGEQSAAGLLARIEQLGGAD
ncbi:MAG: TlpA disulfide reductase family protein [Pseudomonadota bacterium]